MWNHMEVWDMTVQLSYLACHCLLSSYSSSVLVCSVLLNMLLEVSRL